jgi:hypothetical protein
VDQVCEESFGNSQSIRLNDSGIADGQAAREFRIRPPRPRRFMDAVFTRSISLSPMCSGQTVGLP